MIYVFLAVLAVLVIMNVFMLFILRQMAAATGRQVERDAGRIFGMYDGILEEKSRQLELLRQEEEALCRSIEKKKEERGQNAISQTVSKGPKPQVRTAVFRDASFARTYNRVRQSFLVPAAEMVREFKEQLPAETDREREWRMCLEGIQDIFTFDNLYRISILPPERQEELLSGILDERQFALYSEWKDGHPGGSAADFSQWLDGALASVSDQVIVKASPEQAEEKESGALWEADSSICEGIKLIYRDRLYDYSIDDRL